VGSGHQTPLFLKGGSTDHPFEFKRQAVAEDIGVLIRMLVIDPARTLILARLNDLFWKNFPAASGVSEK